jgi:hypothetical protein
VCVQTQDVPSPILVSTQSHDISDVPEITNTLGQLGLRKKFRAGNLPVIYQGLKVRGVIYW